MRTDAHGNIRRGKVSRSFKIEVQELPLAGSGRDENKRTEGEGKWKKDYLPRNQ